MPRNYTDYSNAEASGFDVIPDGTEVPVIFKVQAGDTQDGCLKRSANTGGLMFNLEATITGGKYAKRKCFFGFYMGPGEDDEPTEGQETGINMSKAKLRAITEAARGFSPTDSTAAAVAVRKVKTLRDFDGMECSVILGVEKGTGSFPDKNVLKRVVPYGKAKGPDAADEARQVRSTPAKKW